MSDAVISRRRVLVGAGLAGAAGLVALTPTVARADEEEDSLVGAWRATGSGADLPSFSLLVTFNPGGTLVASASIDLQPAFLSTPSYGAWKRAGDGTYVFKFEFFTPEGSGAARGKAEVDDDRTHASVTITLFDASGKTIAVVPSRLSGHRIEVD